MTARIAFSISVFFAMMHPSLVMSQSDEPKSKSPLEELPDHITRITHFGQRCDFSHDSKRLLFLEKTFGDVYEVELATKIIRPMTHHYFHEGYTRALYLSNGDILLSGARKFDAEDPWPSRLENAELWVLKKDRSAPPGTAGRKMHRRPRCLSAAYAYRLDRRLWRPTETAPRRQLCASVTQ